jgi:DNA-binding PadR family transcriptional regulator
MKDKKFILESARMQKLAGMPVIAESMMADETDLDEMARTAGTGGAYSITDAGKEALKQAQTTGELPEGLRASHVAILIYLFKKNKDGERVQKVDYAREKGVPQPAVNPLFNQLTEKGLISTESYAAKTKEPATSRPRTSIADLGLDDLEID